MVFKVDIRIRILTNQRGYEDSGFGESTRSPECFLQKYIIMDVFTAVCEALEPLQQGTREVQSSAPVAQNLCTRYCGIVSSNSSGDQ